MIIKIIIIYVNSIKKLNNLKFRIFQLNKGLESLFGQINII